MLELVTRQTDQPCSRERAYFMSIGCLDSRDARVLSPIGPTHKMLVGSEAIPGPFVAALLVPAVSLLDRSQPVLPLGVGEFEGAALAGVGNNDFRIVVPVDAEQSLQMAVVGMQSCEVEKGLYAVVLNVLSPCDDGQNMKQLWSGGRYIQEVEEDAVCSGQHSLRFGAENVVDLDDPL